MRHILQIFKMTSIVLICPFYFLKMLHYQRKRRGYHSQTSRSNDSEIEPITNVDTEPTSLSQFYEDVQSRETTMETITDTHVSKRSRRKR